MIMLMRLLAHFLTTAFFAVPVLAFQPAASQDEFLPIDQLPPAEQLPAAPFLIAAYAFVWVALMVYLWFIWRRVGRLEGELAALQRQARRGDRAR